MDAQVTHENTTLATVHPFLERTETQVESCPKVVSYSHDLGRGPVLILVHGYPQSAFIWRHVALLLKDKISLFIPELPGYGITSRPEGDFSITSMGKPLIEAAQRLFPGRDFILGGHDRGGRVCHRIAVDNAHSKSPSDFKVLGLILLDIVPTLNQWNAFSNAKAAAAYFHWPFLAAPMAADMIEAWGPSKWIWGGLDRLSGGNEAARNKFRSDHAWEVYVSQFSQRSALEGSCADYHAGALVEPELQKDDQAAGRKIEVPTLVAWSKRGLGSMHGDLKPIWREWIKANVELRAVPCGDDVGHYLPEEASDLIAGEIEKFVSSIRS